MAHPLISLPQLSQEELVKLPVDLPAGHRRVLIPSGVRGTAATLRLMQGLVANKKRTIQTRIQIGKILNPENGQRPCRPKDYFCYCKTLYEWVRDKILYVYDPHLVEFVESPDDLLTSRIGDCDSQDILLSAMYQSCGFQTQWVTIAADATRPDEFSHVYVRVNIPKIGWVVADPTMPNKWFGWEADSYLTKRYWHGSADEKELPLDESPSLIFSSPQELSAMQTPDHALPQLTGLGGLRRTKFIARKRPDMRGLGDCGCRCKDKSQCKCHGMSGLGKHKHHGGHAINWGPQWGGYWGPPMVEYVPMPVPVIMNPDEQPAVVKAEKELGVPSDYPLGINGLGEASYGVTELGGLSADLDFNVVEILKGVWDGTYVQQLNRQSDELARQTTDLSYASKEVPKLPADKQQTALAKIADGRTAIAAAREKLIQASGKYNFMVREMNKALPSSYQLKETATGIGFLPPAVSALAVKAGVVAAAALAFAAAFNIAMSSVTGTKSIVQDATDFVRASGGAISSTANAIVKVAVVAGIGALAILAFQNRGKIGGALKSLQAKLAR